MDNTFELRQWLVEEIGVKPYHIENHVFSHNGKSRKKELLAMWNNRKERADLKRWVLAVVVPASKTLAYVKISKD